MRLGRIWGVSLCLLLMAYFVFHAFRGEYSIPALKELQQQEVLLNAEATHTASIRRELEAKLVLLSDASIDPDMLEEQVRKRLGFAHPDEVVIFMDNGQH